MCENLRIENNLGGARDTEHKYNLGIQDQAGIPSVPFTTRFFHRRGVRNIYSISTCQNIPLYTPRVANRHMSRITEDLVPEHR